MADGQGQLVLAQNQHVLIQDSTKGTVSVYVGPAAASLGPNDKPVTYDKNKDSYRQGAGLQDCIQQNPTAPEGSYIVLDNPATDSTEGGCPKQGSQAPVKLKFGRKVNIAGPATFPLWPGQSAQVIPGHHLRSNQYVLARVYNVDEAVANCPTFLRERKPANAADGWQPAPASFDHGELIVIKGTRVSFFIPPTGFEVLKDEDGQYVREALTIERLEYAILLNEDGEKRYEKGPQVVFPRSTEKFITNKGQGEDSVSADGAKARKFKAIELTPQMGLYAKVIADYTEGEGPNAKTFKAGEELFITGAEQRIYYPRSEHALIGYDSTDIATGKNFKRERYYAIAIPEGEARYVLNKTTGQVSMKTGPCMFLPDPRTETIVRRILDERTVSLMYPGNKEAAQFNAELAELNNADKGYVIDDTIRNAGSADLGRGVNRSLSSNLSRAGSVAGSYGTYDSSAVNRDPNPTLNRSGKFTPPPQLILNTKYEGVPAISVFTGYAIQVVSKSGQRKVICGPANYLLDYDESLEYIVMSTGKPKTTDVLKKDVYLRVDHNLVSDIVLVETKDLVQVQIKLCYRVNFLRDQQDKWFSVENYVKYLCDHLRSVLRADVKKLTVKEVMENVTPVVRDSVLGTKETDTTRSRNFSENGMSVYDVEVLGCVVQDNAIASIISNAQKETVRNVIQLAADEQKLVYTKRSAEIQEAITIAQADLAIAEERAKRSVTEEVAMTIREEQEEALALAKVKLEAKIEEQKQYGAIASIVLEMDKAKEDQILATEEKRVDMFKDKVGAISEKLIEAVVVSGKTEQLNKLIAAVAPLAISQSMSLGDSVKNLVAGTAFETVLDNVKKNPIQPK